MIMSFNSYQIIHIKYNRGCGHISWNIEVLIEQLKHESLHMQIPQKHHTARYTDGAATRVTIAIIISPCTQNKLKQ